QQQYPAQQEQPYPAQQYPQQPYYGPQPGYPQQQPYFTPQQLDGMVSRIALYPDPLLAQILTASTYSNDIPDAAGWARAHAYLSGGDPLARAIRDDNLPWDPSIVSLLPFPQVLDIMAGDMGWTQQLGNAVLADRGAVMDAIQRQRALAYNYGYLRTNGQIRVVTPGPADIEILPVDPAYVYVPYYDPYVVYARPRPGFFLGGAITFGPRVGIGVFAPWGWGGTAFGWRNHAIIVNNRPWQRTWTNRDVYVHPYAAPRPQIVDRRTEHHELRNYRAPARPEPRPQTRRDDRRDAHRDDRQDGRRGR
ncbi:MAG: DUF3300 domain-containing protein, partial [Acidobacteriota bacterium]|nr:DUF3300 domain-containing protein [Acidobacteriota bacterium]